MFLEYNRTRKKLLYLSKNKDAKKLISNFSYLALLQVIGYVFPLITIPYLARTIGVEGYGKVAFAASIMIYFQTFVDWGFSYTAVRDIAKNRNNIDNISKIFSTVLFCKLLLMIVSTIVLALLVYTIPFLYNYRQVIWCTYLLIPGYIMFTDWFFQAMEEMKYITLMNFASKSIFTLLVFIVIKDETDYVYQPLLMAIGMLICGVWALFYARKRFKIKYIVPTMGEIKSTIIKSSNMFLSLFLPNLYSNFSVILLGIFGGEVATGLYSAGNKFSGICNQFSQVLSRTFYPFLARKIDKHGIYVKVSGTISLLMCITLFLGADLLVDIFYTEEFRGATTVLRILSLSPIFMFLDNAFGTNYLILKGYDKIVRNIVTCSSLIGFVLAVFAVTNWSYIGVAVTIVSVRGIMGITTWLYSRKY